MEISLSELREFVSGTDAKKRDPIKGESCNAIELGYRIVVLQRGWVVVGQVSQVGDEIIVEQSSVIRLWGTTKGLGQLALEGPQSGTKLDPCGTVRAHLAAVVLQMESDGAKWRK